MKKNLPLACYIVSSSLVIAFIVKSILDYTRRLRSKDYIQELGIAG